MRLTRITKLRHRVFRDFVWPSDLHEFGQFNVIYGWNGSGKSTLASLLALVEKRAALTEGHLELEFDGTTKVVGADLASKNVPQVRVFDRDFVTATLSQSAGIAPIYFLGEESAEKQARVDQLKKDLSAANAAVVAAEAAKWEADTKLDDFCVAQAKVIKELLTTANSPTYNNYDKRRFRQSEQALTAQSATTAGLSDEQKARLNSQKNAQPKPAIEKVIAPSVELGLLTREVDVLVSRSVVAQTLRELTTDAKLAAWVQQGLSLHSGKHASDTCRFCEHPIEPMRRAALEAHFNDAFASFQKELTALLSTLEATKQRAGSLSLPDASRFYDALASDVTTASANVSTSKSETEAALEAVRYKQSFDGYIKAKGYPIKSLVAFSGTVLDDKVPDVSYTEEAMNGGLREKELPERFASEEYQVLLVAEKYQTGFDQPLLHTMFIDKRLAGIQAVQTLSRLNRIHPLKEDTFIRDFVNDRDEIRAAFKTYYEGAEMGEEVDPARLYVIKGEIDAAGIYLEAEVARFCDVYFKPKAKQSPLDHQAMNAALDPAVSRFKARVDDDIDEAELWRGKLQAFQNLYGFLSQIIPYQDSDLERLYVFTRHLLSKLPKRTGGGGYQFDDEIRLEYYRLQKISEGSIALRDGEARKLDGPTEVGSGVLHEQPVPLSQLIDIVNERFGTDFNQADQLFFDQIVESAMTDDGLRRAAAVNPAEKFELLFRNVLERLFVDRMDQNEEIFVRFMNDTSFQQVVTAWMADEAYRRLRTTATEAPTEVQPKLRRVRATATDRYVRCVPLLPLQVAAGSFGDPQQVTDETEDWVEVDTQHRLRPGMFVAQVIGRSMEPNIADGAYCLFASPVTGSRQGRTVLVRLRDATDPETGQRYTVKRYESEKAAVGDSWRHSKITLKPTNAEFAPIVLENVEDNAVQVMAELVEVLGGGIANIS